MVHSETPMLFWTGWQHHSVALVQVLVYRLWVGLGFLLKQKLLAATWLLKELSESFIS